MRKVILALFAMSLAVAATAQDIYSAVDISRNDYTGTARTMAMGNAFTAVGGDLGSIGLNPAGSAVAHYSQFSFSPMLALSKASSAYAPTFDWYKGLTSTDFIGKTTPSSKSSGLRLPQFGGSFYVDLGHRRGGLTGISYAVLSTGTGSYFDSAIASGINNETSITGFMAAGAEGIPENDLMASDAASYYPLNTVTAYKAYVISPLVAGGDSYIGAAEIIDGAGNIVTGGPLHQTSKTVSAGYKNDLLFNMGLNFSDNFYLGFSLGVPNSSYSYTENFYEMAQNPEDFPLDDTFLDFSSYQYRLSRSVNGIYGKFGLIFTPNDMIRFGAAFRTPTLYNVSESWDVYQSVDYTYGQGNEWTETGRYDYSIRSPYSANFGLAATLMSRLLLSADYELSDFSVMRFSDEYGTNFIPENTQNQMFLGMQHQFRVGAELRLTPSFSVRGGYNVTTSPIRYGENGLGETIDAGSFDASTFMKMYNSGLLDSYSMQYSQDLVKAFSFGIGYASEGAFFADAAVKCTTFPNRNFLPYGDYIDAVPSPTVRTSRSLWNAMLTLGWRF